MWVVKMGGSLLNAATLSAWLSAIANHANGQVVIVPGGGLFADAVRQAQLKTAVHDDVAHHLALQAMTQFGVLLAGMHPAFVTAESELEIAERSWQHRPIIWLPTPMVLADESIPKNWQVTSDSLSLWLAHKIGATQVTIVKSVMPAISVAALQTKCVEVNTLSDAGYLDAAFNDFLKKYQADNAFEVRVMYDEQHDDFKRGLQANSLQNIGLSIIGK